MRKLVALLAVVMTVGAIAVAPSVAQQPQPTTSPLGSHLCGRRVDAHGVAAGGAAT